MLSVSNTYTITDADVENLTFTGIGNFVGTGNASANEITGGAGNDTLIGGLGNDTLFGLGGDDTFTYTFGAGADTVDGGADSDTLNIIGTAAANVLDVLFDGTALTNFEGGTITGVESVTADLLTGVDTLTYAGTTADVTVDLSTGAASGFSSIAGIENLVGGSGNDALTGAAGVTNTLTGGAGNDTFFVHDDNTDNLVNPITDTVSEANGVAGGIDEVRSFANAYTITDADVENLTFVGVGNFAGTGNASANVITGGAGIDALSGGGGADTLIGGVGNDVMNGGAGNDIFVFGPGFGNDIISGFDANPGPNPPALNQDLLDISGLGITDLDFAARVDIDVLGANTLVTIDGTDTITLLGVKAWARMSSRSRTSSCSETPCGRTAGLTSRKGVFGCSLEKQRKKRASKVAPGKVAPAWGEGMGARHGLPRRPKQRPVTRPRDARQARMAQSFAQIVAVLMRDPNFRNMRLADLEWLVLPPVMAGQFRLAQVPMPQGDQGPGGRQGGAGEGAGRRRSRSHGGGAVGARVA